MTHLSHAFPWFTQGNNVLNNFFGMKLVLSAAGDLLVVATPVWNSVSAVGCWTPNSERSVCIFEKFAVGTWVREEQPTPDDGALLSSDLR